MDTLFWHDYETSGIDPRYDRPLQFAGVRTDLDLNILDAPVNWFCQLSADVLPQPAALMVTGITPATLAEQGLPEALFMRQIHQALSKSGTCGVGYNSIRFDDEFTRFGFYRNFLDPYEREYAQGCSRWDLLDVIRLMHALRPDGIAWPQREDGFTSFRLEALTAANGISHEGAHDALADVLATIALARLVKSHQPKLFAFAYAHRGKKALLPLINLRERTALLHVSGRLPAERHHCAVMMPIAFDPHNANALIMLDLREDPSFVLQASVEEIRLALFTREADRPAGHTRPGLKTVHLNKSPILVPLSALDADSQARLAIDLSEQLAHRDQVLQAPVSWFARIATVYAKPEYPAVTDPDAALYAGFPSTADRHLLRTIASQSPSELAQAVLPFEDAKWHDLLLRYRARNWPESLHATAVQEWEEHCIAALQVKQVEAKLTLEEFEQRLDDCAAAASEQQLSCLAHWRDFAMQKRQWLTSRL